MPDLSEDVETLCKEGLQAAELKNYRALMFFARKAIRKLEKIEEIAEFEDFKESLKKYSQWTAKDIYYRGTYCHLIIDIIKVDWDKEVIIWQNVDTVIRYPYGSSAFGSFMEDFIPIREKNNVKHN